MLNSARRAQLVNYCTQLFGTHLERVKHHNSGFRRLATSLLNMSRELGKTHLARVGVECITKYRIVHHSTVVSRDSIKHILRKLQTATIAIEDRLYIGTHMIKLEQGYQAREEKQHHNAQKANSNALTNTCHN